MVSRFPLSAACVLASALIVAAGPALAKDSDGDRSEARVAGTCSKGATSKLRLRSRDGTIRVEFEVKARHARVWRLVLVHERRVEWRGTVRTHGSSGSFRIRRSLDDLDGPDQVRARASGPRGMTCEASATLSG
ncbi:MAG: hypothetical protein ACXW0R_10450 [Gaiellaceae bacterium]